jgi:hypothetical protein
MVGTTTHERPSQIWQEIWIPAMIQLHSPSNKEVQIFFEERMHCTMYFAHKRFHEELWIARARSARARPQHERKLRVKYVGILRICTDQDCMVTCASIARIVLHGPVSRNSATTSTDDKASGRSASELAQAEAYAYEFAILGWNTVARSAHHFNNLCIVDTSIPSWIQICFVI